MRELSGLRRFLLPSLDLRWEGKGVDQEKPCELLKLLDLFGGKLFIVMRALISIQPYEVRPVPQIRGELAIFRKLINASSQGFSSSRLIKFARGHINGLAKHRRCGVGVPALSIVKTLNERAPNGGRNMLRSVKRLFLRVFKNDSSTSGFGDSVEVACAVVCHPLSRVWWMKHAQTKDFVAAIAGKGCSAFVAARGNEGHRTKSHSTDPAVWAISDQGYRHIHSMDAQQRALRRES